MKPNVANAQTLLDTFCGTKVPRRSTANLQKKISRSCQIMLHAQILPDLLAPFGSTLFFFGFARLQSKGKISAGLVPSAWLAVGFQKCQSVESLCKTHICTSACPLSNPHPLTDFHVWKCNCAVKWLKHQNSEAPERIGDLLWSTTNSKVLCQIHQGQKTSQRKCFWHGVAAAVSSIQILPSAPACWWMTSTGVRPSSWHTGNCEKCIRSLFPCLLMIQWSKESQTSRYNLAQRWSEVTAFNSSITLVLCEVIRNKNIGETWKCHWNTCSTHKSSNAGFKMKLTKWALFKGRNYLYLSQDCILAKTLMISTMNNIK